jgi:hypothetical protein
MGPRQRGPFLDRNTPHIFGRNRIPIPLTGELKGGAVVWTIFVILLVLWLLGFFAFKVTSGLIHLILVVAVIVLILGLVRRGP